MHSVVWFRLISFGRKLIMATQKSHIIGAYRETLIEPLYQKTMKNAEMWLESVRPIHSSVFFTDPEIHNRCTMAVNFTSLSFGSGLLSWQLRNPIVNDKKSTAPLHHTHGMYVRYHFFFFVSIPNHRNVTTLLFPVHFI